MHATFITNSETSQNEIIFMQISGSPEHSLLPGNPDSTQNLPAIHSAQCIIVQLLL